MTITDVVSQAPQPLVIAIIVAVGAIVSPLIMAWLTNRNSIQLKQIDYARQDAVAAALKAQQDAAAETARQLVASNLRQERNLAALSAVPAPAVGVVNPQVKA